MTIPHFVYSPFDGHLGYFQFGTIMNKTAMNILTQGSLWTYVFISLGVELLSHSVVAYITF